MKLFLILLLAVTNITYSQSIDIKQDENHPQVWICIYKGLKVMLVGKYDYEMVKEKCANTVDNLKERK